MAAHSRHLLIVCRSHEDFLPLLVRPTFQRHQPMPLMLDMAVLSMESGGLEEVPIGTC